MANKGWAVRCDFLAAEMKPFPLPHPQLLSVPMPWAWHPPGLEPLTDDSEVTGLLLTSSPCKRDPVRPASLKAALLFLSFQKNSPASDGQRTISKGNFDFVDIFKKLSLLPTLTGKAQVVRETGVLACLAFGGVRR